MDSTPPPLPPSEDARDARHLELLSIFHFIVGGLDIVISGFILLHYWVMRTLLLKPHVWKDQPPSGPTPEEFFQVFVWFYVFFSAFMWLSAAATIASGVMIRRRKARVFILVVAGLNCLSIPFGAALGIFTIIVLTRDSVRRKFAN